jgi:DNA-binding MarR family transcriptional regulator
MALDTFEERYAAFRSELNPVEQRWFDELVCRARRHSNAINRRPHLDFERPVFLSMLLEGMRELESTRRELGTAQRRLKEAMDALSEAGLVVRRVSPPTPEQLDRLGQARLEDVQATRAISP